MTLRILELILAFGTMAIYKFKLKQTIFGYKIDNYKYEYVDYF